VPVILVLTVVVAMTRPAKKPVKLARRSEPARQVSAKPQEPEAFDPLDGLPSTAALAARRPIAVMVENFDPDARPQSGLDKASMVYETVAEGGITRFMAVYLSGKADIVGPIRSAREYYANWAKGLDAIYIHCGGSPGGYDTIASLGLNDIDQIRWSAGFWRSNDRYAPHNLYSSTKNLRDQAAAKGYATQAPAPAYSFKDDPPLAGRPAAQAISVDFSSPAYRVKYVYRRDTNSYLRYMGGAPHTDAVTGKQLTVKNIAVMYAKIWPLNDDENRMGVQSTGGGDAVVIQDGQVITGAWKRNAPSDAVRFYDSTGGEIKLDRGQTWIEATNRPIIPE
ncbi:MAG: DUF3048 domain-containing protein, partial [Chloroflexi bacterium]|nr:DUF3048 domain-containing protein [Chloroflexota bacterium]